MDSPYTPFSAAVRADPYPYYTALRSEAPVYFVEDVGAWAVSRYDDVHAVLTHPEVYSSDAMRTMLIAPRRRSDARDVEAAERMVALAAALPFSIEEMIRARNLIATDPPEHGVMRRIVQRAFTARHITAYASRVRTI